MPTAKPPPVPKREPAPLRIMTCRELAAVCRRVAIELDAGSSCPTEGSVFRVLGRNLEEAGTTAAKREAVACLLQGTEGRRGGSVRTLRELAKLTLTKGEAR